MNFRKILLFFSGLAILGLLIIFGFSAFYFHRFSKEAGLGINEFWQKLNFVISNRDSFSNRRFNFLILGLDRRNDELEKTMLTDTIIFASLNTTKACLNLIPIPRDLWVDSLRSKVNALYYYGELSEDTTGPDFLVSEISRITGQKIDFWLLIDYNKLADLVDVFGGVDVYVEKDFQDDFFPNPKYLTATDSSQPEYLSIKFDKGRQHLSGERALQFIRSRSSADLEEGTDLARSSRQLQLLKALIEVVKNPKLIGNPAKLGRLYKFWKEKVKTNLKDEELITLALIVVPRGMQISEIQIPASYDEQSQEAILIHPSSNNYGLWVWEPRLPDWSELKAFIEKNI